MPDWDDYRYFEALAGTGSVRAAARQLAVNPSTVTRRLDGLEAELGVKLFVRSHAGLRLTADGEELVLELRPLAVRLADLERRLRDRGNQVSGTVRVTMADVFALNLMEDFANYSARHPEVRLEFLPDYRPLDLARGEADLAIRATDQPPGNLIGRLLGRFRLAAYGSLDYLAQRDPLEAPEHCVWIESGLENEGTARFKARHFPLVPVGARCNSVLLQHAAVVAGMGISLLPCALGDGDERLGRVGDLELLDGQDVWLLFHPDLRGVARIQSVSAHLQSAFAALAPRLLGKQDR